MKKKKKNVLKLAGVALWPFLLLGLGIALCQSKSGFSVAKIRPSYEFSLKVGSSPTPEEQKALQEIFLQEFQYIGNGAQCYVFASKDQEYVLKFFKIKHLTPKYWLNYFPLPWMEKYRFEKIDRRENKRTETFSSFKIAFEEFREHTGLVFVHLAKTKNQLRKVCVVDKLQNRYWVPLDEVPFILQKKAVVLYTYLRQLLDQGKETEALAAMRSVLELVRIRCSLGLADKDGGVGANYGFIDGEPVHIDVGRIIRDESLKTPIHSLREVFRVSKKMEGWLQKEYPGLIPRFQEEVHDILDSYELMGTF